MKLTENKNPFDEGNKCGFIAIIGAPNSGKSTLVNSLIGQKISIISQKIQTTRFPIKGIMMHGQAQIILVDTPGVFNPKQKLDRAMVKSVWAGAKDADLLLHIVDGAIMARFLNGEKRKGDSRYIEDLERVEKGLQEQNKACFLIINKIDELNKPELLNLAAHFAKSEIYKEIMFISAKTHEGLDKLSDEIANFIPKGIWLYPEDQASDIPLRLMAAEITREKIFERLHDELPYFTNVETDSWKDQKDGSVRIDQTIYLGRQSHKQIVIGKNGEALKWISSRSRQELIKLLERNVHLFTHVKVRENWQDEKSHYIDRGLDFEQ